MAKRRSSVVVRAQAEREALREEMLTRLYRLANYVTIFLFALVVYGGALVTDFALFGLVAYLLRSEIEDFPLIATLIYWTRLGTAVIAILLAIEHILRSALAQRKLDALISKEVEDEA